MVLESGKELSKKEKESPTWIVDSAWIAGTPFAFFFSIYVEWKKPSPGKLSMNANEGITCPHGNLNTDTKRHQIISEKESPAFPLVLIYLVLEIYQR